MPMLPDDSRAFPIVMAALACLRRSEAASASRRQVAAIHAFPRPPLDVLGMHTYRKVLPLQ
jgi:hypothetical protein